MGWQKATPTSVLEPLTHSYPAPCSLVVVHEPQHQKAEPGRAGPPLRTPGRRGQTPGGKKREG